MNAVPDLSACCPVCAAATLEDSCALDSVGLEDRLAEIRQLAKTFLIRSERRDLVLHLTYQPSALAEVESLVAKEKDCCAFLAFDLKSNPQAVHLMMTAPQEAAEAANALFDHFAPAKPAG